MMLRHPQLTTTSTLFELGLGSRAGSFRTESKAPAWSEPDVKPNLVGPAVLQVRSRAEWGRAFSTKLISTFT